jgi:multidrug resistance efflux pump
MPENETQTSPNSQLPTPDFQLRSEEVQEILTQMPHWMIRWGNIVILMVLCLVFAMSWFIEYPDIVKTSIIITTNVPPEKLVAKTSGRIEALLVEDKSIVNENTPLAIIENAADYKALLSLSSAVNNQNIKEIDFKNILDKFKTANLGDVQQSFSLFEKDFIANKLNVDLKPFAVEEILQSSENIQIKTRLTILNQQKEINENELLLQKNEVNRYQTLFNKDVVSAQDLEIKKLSYLQAEKNYKSLLSNISQLKSALIDNSRNTKNTQINGTKEEVNLERNKLESFYQLKKAIKDWELNYVLRSSIKGKVSFLQLWAENQTVNAGDNVFTIIPAMEKGFIGKVKAAAMNSGKIKIGQKVNIRLTNFPDREFGILNGRVKNISLTPDKEGNLLIDVDLPNGLATSYNKQIVFQQEMAGSSEIVTEDLRLTERLLYQFRDIFRR